MTGYPCPNRLCPNYGKQCFRCCNHCGEEIRWRPEGLDWGIKYTGPKPLDKYGKVHRCMNKGEVKQYKKITNDSIIENINYSKELHNFLKKIHWSTTTWHILQRRN